MESIATQLRCAGCMHFHNDPDFLEQAIPGVASMSSAYASVRGDDGICLKHDRIIASRSGCMEHVIRMA